MLRAIGMTRRQVRRMIRHESVITALIGAVIGIVLGIVLAALLIARVDFIQFSLPVGQLIIFGVAVDLRRDHRGDLPGATRRPAQRARGAPVRVAQARLSAPSAAGIASIAASTSSSEMSRCVTARTTVGCTVVDTRTPCSLIRSIAPGRSGPTSIWTKFVSTCSRSTVHAGLRRALRRAAAPGHGRPRSGRRCGRAHRAPRPRRSRPGASPRRRSAYLGGPDPSARCEPAISAPNGHPSPFEKQIVTVSKPRPIRAGSTSDATAALTSRAPSR